MPTIAETVEVYQDDELVDTYTIERETTPREVEHDAIVQRWGQRRAALLAAYSALADAAPDIIAANQAVQAATTTAQMSTAVKAYASANLTALGAIKDALAWLDGELADLREEAG